MLEETKICIGCNLEKPLGDYYKRVRRPKGISYCKPCCTLKSKIRRVSNPEVYRKHALRAGIKAKHGITLDDFNEMLSFQGGRCAICGTNQCPTRKRLSVDHNHDTGLIRGILCSNCNKGLGEFKDSISLLVKAKEYLERKTVVEII